MDEGRGIYSVAMFQKRDIREDVSFFAADRRIYTNLAKITNISITA